MRTSLRLLIPLVLLSSLPVLAQKGSATPPGPHGGGQSPSRVETSSPPSHVYRSSPPLHIPRSLEGTPDSRPRPHPEGRAKQAQVVVPQRLERCREFPTARYWRSRDLIEEVRRLARRGSIPVVHTDPEATEIVDYTWWPSGWRAYAFLVAPEGNLHVRLHHSNEGWFRLQMMNKWGRLEPGMLHNLIPTGNPEVSFKNPTREWRYVYVLVDDPAWWSSKTNPYILEIKRSWDPKARPNQELRPVEGIWAAVPRNELEQTQPKESFAPEPAVGAGAAVQ